MHDDLDLQPRTGYARSSSKEASAFDVHDEDKIITVVDGFQERKISKLGKPINAPVDWSSTYKTAFVILFLAACFVFIRSRLLP